MVGLRGLVAVAGLVMILAGWGCADTVTHSGVMTDGRNGILDPATRERMFPYADRWTIRRGNAEVYESINGSIQAMGVTRWRYSEYADGRGNSYLDENKYEGLCGVRTPLGRDEALIVWQTVGDKEVAVEIRRKTAERPYLCVGLAERMFKQLRLGVEDVPGTGWRPDVAATTGPGQASVLR